MGSERELRFILTKKQETERRVNITPLKKLRINEYNSGDDDEDEEEDDDGMDESVDANKNWLAANGSTTC